TERSCKKSRAESRETASVESGESRDESRVGRSITPSVPPGGLLRWPGRCKWRSSSGKERPGVGPWHRTRSDFATSFGAGGSRTAHRGKKWARARRKPDRAPSERWLDCR